MSVMLAKEFHKGMSWSKKGEKKKEGKFDQE